MVMCDTCKDEDCLNNTEEGREGINTAEFCQPMIKLVKQRAETYVCNAKIPSEHIEKHLKTIQNAKNFWQGETLFNQEWGFNSERKDDGEMSEDEAEFWTIFDEIVDEIFAE